VGGSVIRDDLDNLITSLVFLNQVGLKPVILHGAGPMLSDQLEKNNIEFSFIDGQRVTSDKVRDVAQKAQNDLMVGSLNNLFVNFQSNT
jgi:acetylglutamate kinase